MVESVKIIIVYLFSAILLDREFPEQNVTISDAMTSLSEVGVFKKNKKGKQKFSTIK